MPVQPRLLGRPSSDRSGVVLVLQGGRVRGRMRGRGYQLASLRMIPLARAIDASARDSGVATVRLRYRYRGWNAPETGDPDPVVDARWALTEIERRFGEVPVVLVGHSMGARVALRVADAVRVVGVAALAPWCEPPDPVAQLAGQDVLMAHGTRDRVTSFEGSLEFARRAQAAGAHVRRIEIEGETHAMLRRRKVWDELASAYVLRRLGRTGDDPSADQAGPNDLGIGSGGAEDPLRLRV